MRPRAKINVSGCLESSKAACVAKRSCEAKVHSPNQSKKYSHETRLQNHRTPTHHPLAPAHALVIHPDIWFSSDNGNIQCGGYSQYSSGIVCEIYQRQDNIQPHTARPEACGNGDDWGYRFALDDRGEARAFCVNDKLTTLNSTPLANGATQRRKNWQCTSLSHGITCQNADKHGFTLTRTQQRLF